MRRVNVHHAEQSARIDDRTTPGCQLDPARPSSLLFARTFIIKMRCPKGIYKNACILTSY
jgi:hypothetical protein